MKKRCSKSFAVGAFVLLSMGLSTSAVGCPASESPDQAGASGGSSAYTVDQVLDWLPADTETVIVTKGPFKPETLDEKNQESITLGQALEELALGPLVSRRAAPKRELSGETVAFVVEAARKFRSPRNLGMMPYNGCHVVVFQRDISSVAASVLKAIQEEGGKLVDVTGQKAVAIKIKEEGDSWTYYVVQPRPHVILWATDRPYLEEVLKRMEKKGQTRALPADLPEWKQVDTKARYWAIRHYDKTNAAIDPSSPLTPEKRAANHPDEKAIGMTFSYDPDNKMPPRVRYLSTNEFAQEIVKVGWTLPGEGLEPDVKVAAKGVVEITADIKEFKTRQSFLLVLLAGLGHGVYL